jgi:hypothetical protein
MQILPDSRQSDPSESSPEAAAESPRKGNTRRSTTPEDRRVYPSLAEAQKNRPEGKESWTLFQVTDPTGRHRWTWANYYSTALWQVAVDADGYTIISVDELPTKSEVKGMLAALSPEDRAVLIAEFVPAPNSTPAPAPEKAPGKKAK